MNRIPAVLMFLLVLITLTAMITAPALAQVGQSRLTGVRCGTFLVKIGVDTKETILKKCGEPTYRYPGSSGGGEVWSYNRGSGRFSGTMSFTGPKLTSITKTGYGHSN